MYIQNTYKVPLHSSPNAPHYAAFGLYIHMYMCVYAYIHLIFVCICLLVGVLVESALLRRYPCSNVVL